MRTVAYLEGMASISCSSRGSKGTKPAADWRVVELKDYSMRITTGRGRQAVKC